MKMKKLFALLLTAAMVLSLAACGGGNDTAADTGNGGDAAASELTLGYDFNTDTEHFGPVYDEWSDMTDEELMRRPWKRAAHYCLRHLLQNVKVVEPFLEDYPGLNVDVMDRTPTRC